MPIYMMSKVSKTNKKGRYSNVKKATFFGKTFDSKREAMRYLDLRDQVKQGLIRDLVLQPRIKITIGGIEVRYQPSNRHMVYQADFQYIDNKTGKTVLEDVKMQSGFRTEIYKFKKALIHSMGLVINEV